MTNHYPYKNKYPEHSRANRIQSFLKSKYGFRIGIILISVAIISLIEIGLILVFFMGDIINNDIFMSYAKQRMILFNFNEVTLYESTVPDMKAILFRIGFLAVTFGIIIGFFCFGTSPQPTFQSRKRFLTYSSIILIILGFILLILPF